MILNKYKRVDENLKGSIMINSLNPAMMPRGVNFQNNVPTAPVSVQNNTPPQTVTNPNLGGLEAIASYNQPVKTVKKEIQPSLPTIMQPEAVHAIQGEKVTNAEGKLDSIVSKNDKTTTVYVMDSQAPNDAIQKILYFDNATGNLTRVQENTNEIKQGQMPVVKEILIREFDANGDIQKMTKYDENNKYVVHQHEKMPDGTKKDFGIFPDGSSNVAELDAQGNYVKVTSFSDKGEIAEVVNFKDDRESQIITYKNGIPAKVINKEKGVYNPELAKIPAQDKDIVPAQPYILGYEPKNVQGDKKFYSNGVVQEISTTTANGKVVHKFDSLGELQSITVDENGKKKEITYDYFGGNKGYRITEELGDVKKETTFHPKGHNVLLTNKTTGEERHAEYTNDGKLLWYGKYNDQTNERFGIGFDKDGNITEMF